MIYLNCLFNLNMKRKFWNKVSNEVYKILNNHVKVLLWLLNIKVLCCIFY